MLLFILKWLGILLLIILGLLILALLLICLVPIRYRVKARVQEGLKAKGDVSWLFRLVHVKAAAINLQILCIILVFGHCFKKQHIGKWGEEETDSQEEETPQKQDASAKATEASGKKKSAADQEKKNSKEQKNASQKKDKYEALFEKLEKEEKAQEAGEEPPSEEGQKAQEKLKELVRKAQAFWEDEKNRDAVALIERQLLRLGKHLLPTHFLLEGEIGLADLAATGKLVGWIYRFYPLYGDHIRLRGVFDRQTINIYTEIRGRLRLGILVEIALRLLLNRRCRGWLKQLRKKDDQEDQEDRKQKKKRSKKKEVIQEEEDHGRGKE